MKEITISYDDGRPSSVLALDAMVTSDPFAWDGMVREGRIDPAEGYPAPQTVRLASRQILRTDVEEMLRLDVTWVDGALTANTERLPSHVPGVTVHVAHEQAGRTLVLANKEEVGHVAQVEIDGEVVLQRRFGYLCNIGKLRSAVALYCHASTSFFQDLLDTDEKKKGESSESQKKKELVPAEIELKTVCLVHELIRREHPEWYRPELSEQCGRPVWEEEKICAEHGYLEAAWWRTAARAAADGAFYSPKGDEIAQAFVWRPAVAWWKSNSADFDGTDADEEHSGEPKEKRVELDDVARWLGLPDYDYLGNSAIDLVKDSWNDRVKITDADSKLANVLSTYGVDLASRAKKEERCKEAKAAEEAERRASISDAHARMRGRLRGRPGV